MRTTPRHIRAGRHLCAARRLAVRGDRGERSLSRRRRPPRPGPWNWTARLGEAHTSLGFCLDGFDWNFEAGGKELRRALELNPGYATAHHWYAWHLALLHRYDDAIVELRKAESLDPLSLVINADLAELLALAHWYDESIVQVRRRSRLNRISASRTITWARHTSRSR